MPALSNGNTCWGNRKAFNVHSEYICDSFPLGNLFEDNTERRDFISSNSYYGFHRIPDPPVEESMAIDEIEEPQVSTCDNAGAACRKRSNSADQNVEIVKRVRHQEPLPQMTQQEPGPSQIYDLRRNNFNSNTCLL